MHSTATQQLFDRAILHHQAGQLPQAEGIYRQILTLDPNHADALHMLGIIAHQVGQNLVAADLIRRAIAIHPNVANFHSNLGLALNGAKRFAEAIPALESALRLDPNLPEAHNNLAIALWQTGHHDPAIVSWQNAIRLRPNMAEAHNSLGAAYQQLGCLDAAAASLRTALKLNPNLFETHNNLGIVLRLQGKLDEAIASLRQAVRLKPDRADFANNLGGTLWARGSVGEAARAFEHAIALSPNDAALRANLGSALWACGKIDDAAEQLQTALKLNPNSADALGHLGDLLQHQGQLESAIENYRKASALRPDDPTLHSNRIFLLHFLPDFEPSVIQRELQAWRQRYADPLKPLIQVHVNDRDPQRRLRIGYISPDFRQHAVGRFMLPLLRNHDRQKFEIVGYSDAAAPDAMTDQLRAACDKWVRITGRTDADVSELIRGDRIDILVDLTSHTPGNRLLVFARKPSPVQVTYLSYPSTTGLDTIDYRLTDPFLDPPDAITDWYSEQSIRLPQTYWCYDAVAATPDVNPLPALKNGHVTFGSLNTFRKVSTNALQTWCRILREVRDARLILLAGDGSPRTFVRNMFTAAGIDSARIEFVGYSPIQEYLQTYQRIDIALDTFPYTGGTTICDALWMGVPVVTLAGLAAVHRGGVSILSNLGMPELIADSTDDYVRIATQLANDRNRLSELRASLRPTMQSSPLMNAAQFAQNVEVAYRNMWQRWCNSAPPT